MRYSKVIFAVTIGIAFWACKVRIAETDLKADNNSNKSLNKNIVAIEINANTSGVLSKELVECYPIGVNKLEVQAKSYGITIDPSTIRLTGHNSNITTAYYWWSADVTNIGERADLFPQGKPKVLTKMTQKSVGTKGCF